MWIVVDDGVGEREVHVVVGAPDVTVGEVLRAAGTACPEVVAVGRRVVSAATRWSDAGIRTGDTIRLATPPLSSGHVASRGVAPRSAAGGGSRVGIVAGPGAGSNVPLGRAVVVGRAPECDLTVEGDGVAARHCRIARDAMGTVVVTDLGASGGTWVGGHLLLEREEPLPVGDVVRVGPVVLRVEPLAVAATVDDSRPGRPQTGPTVPVNRPPRTGPPAPVPPVPVPAPPAAPSPLPPVSVVAVVVPVLLAAVMVVVLGSWRYAAFLALSPVLLVATTVSARRRAGRQARGAARDHGDAVAAFASQLERAAAVTRQRRWEVLPSVTEVLDRAIQPTPRLWERRPWHDDALLLHVGVGPVPWQPVARDGSGAGGAGTADPAVEVDAVLEEWAVLRRSPVGVDLADGGVVGIVGARAAAVALARSLVLQACVHHGPADLALAVATTVDGVDDWSWAGWLPHVAGTGAQPRIAVGAAANRALFAMLRARTAGDATVLVVIDERGEPRADHTDARVVLRGAAGPVAGVVLAARLEQLPAECDTVVEVHADGTATVSRPARREAVRGVMLAGLATSTCRAAARRLASREDPEDTGSAGGLPARVDLLDLLPERLDVAAAWRRTSAGDGLSAPLLASRDGPVDLDLVRDGPHCLVGGTTGAGKSELLRSLVAGLAATHGPDRCTFVLVDYKGGAAFDACADLPHVLGVVTDLDEHLGRRVLRSLEAELRHREQRLRAAGVSDLAAWLSLGPGRRGDPLPRLVVVVDEFATLRADLPDVVSSLVGIAQRGRSLGVHLVLGTQRPSGAVDDDVRANTALRIALRTTDARDGVDVVGVNDPASIPPSVPGRALLRTGPDEPVTVQVALVTGRSGGEQPRVRVAPAPLGAWGGAAGLDVPAASPAAGDRPSDLQRLVAACRAAMAGQQMSAPRPIWLPPLPAVVAPGDLPLVRGTRPGRPVSVPIGLLDDPDRQQQVTVGWDPAGGSLLVLGAVGSGTTTTLAITALAAARSVGPDDLHLHVLDLGGGALTPLAGLPHCGAVVTAGEPDRRVRLQAWLLAEAERRRQLDAARLDRCPRHVLVVDGLDVWLDELDTPATYAGYEAVQRFLTDAPRLRMGVVASAPRPGAVRSSIAASVEQRLVHRLADPNDYAMSGLRPGDVPELPPGRALRPDGGVLQVARAVSLHEEVVAIAAASGTATRPPVEVPVLPEVVHWARVSDDVALGEDPWRLPVGVDAVTLESVTWTLHRGDHALVLGPPASGRTSLLAALAAVVEGDVRVLAFGAGAWPTGVESRPAADLVAVLERVAAGAEPTLLLIDDADAVPDPGAALAAVAAARAPVHLVVTARPDTVRGDYGHWLRRLGRSRCGLLLQSDRDAAGDVLGVRLPARPPVAVRPGRGWCTTGGAAQFVQLIAAAG